MHINRKPQMPVPVAIPARYPGHREAYRLLRITRRIDEEAPNFLRKNLGWSYHAPAAGHEARRPHAGPLPAPGLR